MLRCLVILGAGLALLAPARLHAQDTERAATRWGASVSFVPSWKVPEGDGPFAKLASVYVTGAEDGVNVKGSDFRIGFVRGSSSRRSPGL